MSADTVFHVDDICCLKDNPSAIGEVDRTPGEVDSHEPYPEKVVGEKIRRHKSLSKQAFKKFLEDGVPPQGYVLVQWQTLPYTELLPEKKLQLLDRTFEAGDIVKKSVSSAMSGTVIKTMRRVGLNSSCEVREKKTGRKLRTSWPPPHIEDDDPFELVPESLEGPEHALSDIPASELQYSPRFHEDDVVIYKGWLGEMKEVIREEVTIRLFDNSIVVVRDEQELEPLNGTKEVHVPGDLVKTKKANLRTGRWIFGAYNPNVVPIGVVVEVRLIEAQVHWRQLRLDPTNRQPEPPLIVGPDELESEDFIVYDRSRRPSNTSGAQSETLTIEDIRMEPGLRVRFRDLADASVKYDGTGGHGKVTKQDRRDTFGYDMNVFTVNQWVTETTVQWQDCSITTELSTSLIPDPAIDDEDAVYPGEIVCSNEKMPNTDEWITRPVRLGIAQKVVAADRMAQVRWSEHASVRFMKEDGTILMPFNIGNIDLATEDVSLYDIHVPAAINMRRGDIVLVFPEPFNVSGRPQPWQPNTGDIDWVGEVVDIGFDGTITVRLGASKNVRDVHLRADQVTLFLRANDPGTSGEEPNEGDFDDSMSWQYDTSPIYLGGPGDEMTDEQIEKLYAGMTEYEYEDGTVPEDEDQDDAWDTENEDGDDTEDEDEDEDNETDAEETESLDEQPVTPGPQQSEAAHSDVDAQPQRETSAAQVGLNISSLSSFADAPPAYEIVDSAVPADHHFATTEATTIQSQIKAVQKDHKILRTSSALPEGVFVRSWESRMDLLRVLFVGPVDTPYELAPFVFDIHLPPNYPNEPPIVYFHSWTAEGAGLQGRVNPNLYEDGKICLSLLGTWQGDRTKGEGWTPGQSTILQLLVSILGLVLVKEPYFNEAGYEPLQTLSSSRLASTVYTERTYLRARAFLLYAVSGLWHIPTLTPGLNGVIDVLQWLYRTETGPMLLKKAVESGNAIVSISESTEAREDQRDGLRLVSKGACLPLKRVLARLEGLSVGSS
ncbi:hypothetical protein M8818_007000 [Zalaria obscura]|uniref:Uncharacterized protein n=1 Tax=Zalaria obscura TaxID=2024903 RepID=A0ACC3S4U4_9PEZI